MLLTKEEKQFLRRQGMPSRLIKDGRVFAISEEAARHFDADREALVEIAKRCGLSERDLLRINRAKARLNALHPADYYERRAAFGLRAFLGCAIPEKKAGRPGRVTAEDRDAMHQEADELRQQGKTTRQIVRALSQKYELRLSYTKRILEDRTVKPVATSQP
jgi:hypothetical protein